MTRPINVVSYAQIVFKKLIFSGWTSQCARLTAAASDAMTLSLSDWLFYLEGGTYSAILCVAP